MGAAVIAPMVMSAGLSAMGSRKNKPASAQVTIPQDIAGLRQYLAEFLGSLFGMPMSGTGQAAPVSRSLPPKTSFGGFTGSRGLPLWGDKLGPGGGGFGGGNRFLQPVPNAGTAPTGGSSGPAGAAAGGTMGGGLLPSFEQLIGRYANILSPDFFNTATLGGDPEATVARIAEAQRPIFEQDLSRALDLGASKLGAQYGIRYGTDLGQTMQGISERALAERTASLMGLYPEVERNFLTGLSLYGDLLTRAGEQSFYEPLRLALQMATAVPGANIVPGTTSAATMLSQYPMYYALLNSNNKPSTPNNTA